MPTTIQITLSALIILFIALAIIIKHQKKKKELLSKEEKQLRALKRVSRKLNKLQKKQ